MNHAIIVGRLTKAPEQKATPNGVAVTRFTVAVNRRFNRGETDFIPVVTWDKLALRCSEYLVQGQRVAVMGEIHTRTWEQDGQKRYATEINADEVEFLDRPAQTAASTSPYGQQYQGSIFDEAPESQVFDEEDIPF